MAARSTKKGTSAQVSEKRPVSAIDSRKELILAIDEVARRGGISRDRALAAWYAATLLGIDEDEAIDAASVDGPADGGCDFIYIDEEQETIYVLQGYVSDRPERTASARKWNALVAAIANVRDPVSFLHAGRGDIYERLREAEGHNYTLTFGLVSLAAKSDTIARARETANRTKAYGTDVSFFYEHQETLYDQYLVARVSERSVPKDSLQFAGPVAQVKGDFGQAIVGTVQAKELVRLHQKHRNQLFEGNVRLFIGQRKGGINERIVETAQTRPGEFWALNNGITIVAESFERLNDTKFDLRLFSVVNGCQTTVSLFNAVAKSEKAGESQVLVRVVAARPSLLTDIVRYNNTQNPVRLSAVRLLDPIQEALRKQFDTIGYQYAPKQEGAKQTRSEKRIDLDKVAQYLAALSDDTVLEAVGNKAELFDRSYRNIFPRGLLAERVYLSWLLANAVEHERVELLAGDVSDDPVMKAILGIHGTPWGIYVGYFLIEKVGTDLSKLTLKKMASADFKNAIAKYAKKSIELYSEIAINIVSGDGETNPRNAIRVRSFHEKLKRTLSVRTARPASLHLPRLQSVGA